MDQVKFFEKLLELAKENKIALSSIAYGGTQDFQTHLHEQGPMSIFSLPSSPPVVDIDLNISLKDNVLKERLMESIVGKTNKPDDTDTRPRGPKMPRMV
jgi:hypothetical protein